MKIKVDYEILDKDIEYILEGADIGYWGKYINEEMTLVEETETKTVFKVDLKKGFKLMAEKSPKKFSDIIKDDYDSETGDILVQYACFGELTYG